MQTIYVRKRINGVYQDWTAVGTCASYGTAMNFLVNQAALLEKKGYAVEFIPREGVEEDCDLMGSTFHAHKSVEDFYWVSFH